jgi:hypothetical protein
MRSAAELHFLNHLLTRNTLGAKVLRCVLSLCYIRMQSVGTVLQPNVRAKRSIEYFIGFWLRILRISHDLFDADDLMTLRALAEAMTGTIHFIPWSKPTQVGQFWFFHAPSLPQPG